MAIFNSYVSLPEGKLSLVNSWFPFGFPRHPPFFDWHLAELALARHGSSALSGSTAGVCGVAPFKTNVMLAKL